jgi:hypothetical protein
MPKMNPEIKAKWVAALRSGEYKQGRGQLRSEDRFCCLGVLCDLHAKETGGGWTGFSYEGGTGTLSDGVKAWAELDTYNPYVSIGEMREVIAAHNDGDAQVPARTFAEIADAIEAQL